MTDSKHTPGQVKEAKRGLTKAQRMYVKDGSAHGDIQIARLQERVRELEQFVDEATKALTGLTCGGSEFFIRDGYGFKADIPACVAWIKQSREDLLAKIRDLALENRKLRASTTEEGEGG